MRLIDADALRAEFKEDERGLYHYTGIWAAIDAAPTIDAVPVVRCKDCKWWEERDRNGFVGRCNNPLNGLTNEFSDDEDFCSYGERKTE